MELRLVVVANAWPIEQRNALDKLRVDAQVIRERRFIAQRTRRLFPIPPRSRITVEQLPRDPFELALDLSPPDQRVDRVDGGESRIPHRLRVILAEVFHQVRELRIRDARE